MQAPKGLILAGDHARATARERSGGRPGELMPVANVPILFHTLARMGAAGISEVGVVLRGRAGDEIREAISAGPRRGLRVTCIQPAEPPEPVDALLAAEPFLGDAPFLLQPGTSLMREDVGQLADTLRTGELDALLLLCRHAHDAPADVTDARTARLLREVAGGEAAAGARLSGSYGFTPAVFRALADSANAHEQTCDLGDVVAAMLDGGARVGTRVLDGWWCYGGRPEDLLEANRIALDALAADVPPSVLHRSEIQGRVVVHPLAELRSTTVRGPAIIGPRARLTDAFIGPYTSIGADVTIESSEVEHSIILPGASIRYLGLRLEGSVVGSGAKISRDFALPRAMRLRVGDDVEISLA